MSGKIHLFNRLFAAGVGLPLIGFSLGTAQASVIYSYEENLFSLIKGHKSHRRCIYTTSNRVTGSFRLASPLSANSTTLFHANPSALLDFTFTDGRITFDSENLPSDFDLASFSITTNGVGAITDWQVTMGDGWIFNDPDVIGNVSHRIFSQPNADQGRFRLCTNLNSSGGCSAAQDDLGHISNSPGLWTGPTAQAPEPGTIAILGLGLAGLGLMRRRKRATA